MFLSKLHWFSLTELKLEDTADYRSHYGYVITWFGGPVIWSSRKHDHVGESSAEDEYMAMCHAAKHLIWMRELLTDMELQQFITEPTLLLGDNKQATRWGREDMITSGNRFIEWQYFKTRDWVKARIVEPRYISTKVNCSDMLTKAVSREDATVKGQMLSGIVDLPEIPTAEDALQDGLRATTG